MCLKASLGDKEIEYGGYYGVWDSDVLTTATETWNSVITALSVEPCSSLHHEQAFKLGGSVSVEDLEHGLGSKKTGKIEQIDGNRIIVRFDENMEEQ